MAQLPKVRDTTALTQAPRSRVTAADVANPYMQIAEALGDAAELLRTKDIEDSAYEGQNAVYRDEAGDLRIDLRSNISASGRSYNRAAIQSYTARLAGDIRKSGVDLADQARGDPAAFDREWKGFAGRLISKVPKEVRGPVTTLLESEGSKFRLGVSETKRTRDLKTFEADLKAEIGLLDDEMAALARANGTGTDAYLERQSQVRSLYGELAANPDFAVGEKEAEISLKRMESRHLALGLVGRVESTLTTAGVGEARKLAETVLTDAELGLSPAERQQYHGLMNERINGFLSQKKAELKPVQERAKTIKSRLAEGVGLDADDIDQTARMLAQGGDMAGAMELITARAKARYLSAFEASPDAEQADEFGRYRAGASRSRAPSRPISVAPELSGRMKQAVDHYIARGLSPIAAAGIVGNLVQESSLRTSAVNPGDGRDGSDSIGLGQWNAERAQALRDFARARGASVDDFATQLDFVLHELETTESAAFERLKAATNVDEATAAMIGYERPAGWSPDNPRGGHGWSNRVSMAAKAAELAGLSGEAIAVTSAGADFADVDPEIVKAMRAEVTADAKDLFADMQAGVVSSLPPSSDEIGLLSRQLSLIDDEDFRSEVRTFFESEAAAAALQGVPPEDREALVSALRADVADGATIAQQEIVKAAERSATQQAEALAKDPIGYGIERGLAPPMPPINPAAGPDQIAADFAARQRAVDAMRAGGLIGNRSALRPQDEAATAQFFANATPAEQASFLGAMSRSLSPDTMQATLAGLAAKGETRGAAIAGALYADNPAVAEGVLRGQMLLRENSNLAPKKDQTFTSTVDAILPTTAFAPTLEGARQTLVEAAIARYADLSHQVGDTSQEMNEDRFTKAVNEVTGGVLEFNGEPIIAPRYGMSQDEFDDLMRGRASRLLIGAATKSGEPILLRDVLSEGRLRGVGDGLYVIEFGADTGFPTYAQAKSELGGVFLLDLRGG